MATGLGQKDVQEQVDRAAQAREAAFQRERDRLARYFAIGPSGLQAGQRQYEELAAEQVQQAYAQETDIRQKAQEQRRLDLAALLDVQRTMATQTIEERTTAAREREVDIAEAKLSGYYGDLETLEAREAELNRQLEYFRETGEQVNEETGETVTSLQKQQIDNAKSIADTQNQIRKEELDELRRSNKQQEGIAGQELDNARTESANRTRQIENDLTIRKAEMLGKWEGAHTLAQQAFDLEERLRLMDERGWDVDPDTGEARDTIEQQRLNIERDRAELEAEVERDRLDIARAEQVFSAAYRIAKLLGTTSEGTMSMEDLAPGLNDLIGVDLTEEEAFRRVAPLFESATGRQMSDAEWTSMRNGERINIIGRFGVEDTLEARIAEQQISLDTSAQEMAEEVARGELELSRAMAIGSRAIELINTLGTTEQALFSIEDLYPGAIVDLDPDTGLQDIPEEDRPAERDRIIASVRRTFMGVTGREMTPNEEAALFSGEQVSLAGEFGPAETEARAARIQANQRAIDRQKTEDKIADTQALIASGELTNERAKMRYDNAIRTAEILGTTEKSTITFDDLAGIENSIDYYAGLLGDPEARAIFEEDIAATFELVTNRVMTVEERDAFLNGESVNIFGIRGEWGIDTLQQQVLIEQRDHNLRMERHAIAEDARADRLEKHQERIDTQELDIVRGQHIFEMEARMTELTGTTAGRSLTLEDISPRAREGYDAARDALSDLVISAGGEDLWSQYLAVEGDSQLMEEKRRSVWNQMSAALPEKMKIQDIGDAIEAVNNSINDVREAYRLSTGSELSADAEAALLEGRPIALFAERRTVAQQQMDLEGERWEEDKSRWQKEFDLLPDKERQEALADRAHDLESRRVDLEEQIQRGELDLRRAMRADDIALRMGELTGTVGAREITLASIWPGYDETFQAITNDDYSGPQSTNAEGLTFNQAMWELHQAYVDAAQIMIGRPLTEDEMVVLQDGGSISLDEELTLAKQELQEEQLTRLQQSRQFTQDLKEQRDARSQQNEQFDDELEILRARQDLEDRVATGELDIARKQQIDDYIVRMAELTGTVGPRDISLSDLVSPEVLADVDALTWRVDKDGNRIAVDDPQDLSQTDIGDDIRTAFVAVLGRDATNAELDALQYGDTVRVESRATLATRMLVLEQENRNFENLLREGELTGVYEEEDTLESKLAYLRETGQVVDEDGNTIDTLEYRLYTANRIAQEKRTAIDERMADLAVSSEFNRAREARAELTGIFDGAFSLEDIVGFDVEAFRDPGITQEEEARLVGRLQTQVLSVIGRRMTSEEIGALKRGQQIDFTTHKTISQQRFEMQKDIERAIYTGDYQGSVTLEAQQAQFERDMETQRQEFAQEMQLGEITGIISYDGRAITAQELGVNITYLQEYIDEMDARLSPEQALNEIFATNEAASLKRAFRVAVGREATDEELENMLRGGGVDTGQDFIEMETMAARNYRVQQEMDRADMMGDLAGVKTEAARRFDEELELREGMNTAEVARIYSGIEMAELELGQRIAEFSANNLINLAELTGEVGKSGKITARELGINTATLTVDPAGQLVRDGAYNIAADSLRTVFLQLEGMELSDVEVDSLLRGKAQPIKGQRTLQAAQMFAHFTAQELNRQSDLSKFSREHNLDDERFRESQEQFDDNMSLEAERVANAYGLDLQRFYMAKMQVDAELTGRVGISGEVTMEEMGIVLPDNITITPDLLVPGWENLTDPTNAFRTAWQDRYGVDPTQHQLMTLSAGQSIVDMSIIREDSEDSRGRALYNALNNTFSVLQGRSLTSGEIDILVNGGGVTVNSISTLDAQAQGVAVASAAQAYGLNEDMFREANAQFDENMELATNQMYGNMFGVARDLHGVETYTMEYENFKDAQRAFREDEIRRDELYHGMSAQAMRNLSIKDILEGEKGADSTEAVRDLVNHATSFDANAEARKGAMDTAPAPRFSNTVLDFHGKTLQEPFKFNELEEHAKWLTGKVRVDQEIDHEKDIFVDRKTRDRAPTETGLSWEQARAVALNDRIAPYRPTVYYGIIQKRMVEYSGREMTDEEFYYFMTTGDADPRINVYWEAGANEMAAVANLISNHSQSIAANNKSSWIETVAAVGTKALSAYATYKMATKPASTNISITGGGGGGSGDSLPKKIFDAVTQ